MRSSMKIFLPLGVLALALLSAFSLWATRTEIVPEAPSEKVWTVAAEVVEVADQQPEMKLFGQVVAGREAELRALVVGPVLKVGKNFAEGGTVKAGELLLEIDPFDYRAALDERTAQLAEARARRDEIEARRKSESDGLVEDKAQLDLTKRDLARIKKLQKRGAVSEKRLDDARIAESRQTQLVSTRRNMLTAYVAQLAQQSSKIKQLEVGVRRAKRDLQRTKLVAPFDGYLLNKAADRGRRLSLNDPIAKLIDAGRLEVRIHVSDDQYGRLVSGGGVEGREARVLWRAGEREFEYKATVERAGARIDAASGGVDLYARLQGSGPDQPIRPGAFVEVMLRDRKFAGVVRLNESALHGTVVYVAVEGRLEAREVEVVGRVGDDVLVRGGLNNGDRAVTTRFAEIGPGLKIELR